MPKKLQDIKPPKHKPSLKRMWLKPRASKDNFLGPFLALGLAIFLILNLLFIVQRTNSVKQAIITFSESGLASLEEAKDSIYKTNWKEAQINFNQAQASFEDLSQQAKLIQGTVLSPKLLSQAGENLSKTGYILSEVADTLSAFPDQLLSQNKAYQEDPTINIYENSLTKPIQEALPRIQEANQYLDSSLKDFKKINQSLLPDELLSKFNQGIQDLEDIQSKLQKTQEYLPTVLKLFGADHPHTYLVLLQNSNEIRPGGGFIGSLIFAETNQGYLTQLENHSVYDYDGQLSETLAIPPEFIGFIDQLFIRDANFSPDFATNAKRVETLLQRAKAPSFDTIIALDNYILSDLLSLSGSLSLPSYPGSQVSAENFDIILNYLENSSANGSNLNSEFISSFREQILQANLKEIAPVVFKNIQEKHLQFFSKQKDIQSIFTAYNLTPQTPSPKYNPKNNQDYLLVTSTSIGGNKTDKYISQRLIHRTQISSDGQISNHLTIRKYNGFQESYIQSWKTYLKPFGITNLDRDLLTILGRGTNKTRVKVFVPKGSQLLNTEGLDFSLVKQLHDPETDLDYFLLEMRLDPLETQEISLDYSLPFKLKPKPAALYDLILQTQAGVSNLAFEKQYNFSLDFSSKHYYPQDYSLSETGEYTSKLSLNQDTEFAVIFE